VHRAQRRKETRAPNSLFDAASKEYQSPGCASAGRLLSLREKKLTTYLAKKNPHQNMVKIRSRKQWRELLRTNSSQMNPKFKPNPEALAKRKHAIVAPGVTRAHLIYWWSRPPKDLPTFVRFGLCINKNCGKVAITLNEIPKRHWRCYHAWMRTPEGKSLKSLIRQGLNPILPQQQLGLRVKVPSEGLSGTENSLKISFSWAIQYYLAGKSYQTIGKENNVDWTSVRERIASLIEKLPEPDLLQKRWQRAVIFLLEASLQRQPMRVSSLTR
jgi:hypothetical protein